MAVVFAQNCEDLVVIVKIIRKTRLVFALSFVSWNDLFIYLRQSGDRFTNRRFVDQNSSLNCISDYLHYIIAGM